MSEQEHVDFIFIGEDLALDLVNTVLMVRGSPRDLLESPEVAAAWWAEAQAHHFPDDVVESKAGVFDTTLLTNVKTLRDALRRLFTSIVEGQAPDAADIEALNRVLRTVHPALAWDEATPKLLYEQKPGSEGAMLLPVALSALHLLTSADLSRLHKCHNERCILMFYDTTKSGTRRWCRTVCFDRERARLRYQQKHE